MSESTKQCASASSSSSSPRSTVAGAHVAADGKIAIPDESSRVSARRNLGKRRASYPPRWVARCDHVFEHVDVVRRDDPVRPAVDLGEHRSAQSLARSDQLRVAAALARLRGHMVQVEGNIGSGKSTLVESIRVAANAVASIGRVDTGGALDVGDSKRASLSATPSPPVKCVVHGEKVNPEFLAALYEHPKRNAFAFQTYMLTTRIHQMETGEQQAVAGAFVLLDRGAVCDTLFATQNHRLGNMTDADMRVYRSVCNERLPKSLSNKVSALLMLDVHPEECHNRMQRLRKRDAEVGVPLDYLDGIDSCYFHLLVNWIAGRKDGVHDMNVGPAPPIVVLPWEQYGDTPIVMETLADAVDGVRRSPTIEFVADDDVRLCAVAELVPTATAAAAAVPPFAHDGSTATVETTLHTRVDVHRAYEKCQRVHFDFSKLASSRPRVVAINWALQHSNEFRRVVMDYLCTCDTILFYGVALDKSTRSATRRAMPELLVLGIVLVVFVSAVLCLDLVLHLTLSSPL